MQPISPLPQRFSLLAFAKDDADIKSIRDFADKQGWKDAVILQGDIRTAIQHLKTHVSPNWLMVEIPPAEEARPLLDALAEVCDVNTKVSTLGSINEYSFYRWLKSIGICSYVLKPLTPAAMEEAWQAASYSPWQTSESTEKKDCHVIAVTGVRGGVGASTLAMNLAAAITELSDKEVALVELDPQTGSMAMALDMEPCHGMLDALEKPERIDSLFLERVMSRPLGRLALLSAEESLRDAVIHTQAASALLNVLKKDFDVIVLDCTYHLRRFTRQCMSFAQHVILVTEMTGLSLRDTVRLHDFLRETQPSASFMIAANRLGFASRYEISAKDYEHVLSAPITASIPFVPDVYMVHGKNIPAIRNKKHRAVAPLYRLAQQLLAKPGDLPPERRAKSFFSLTTSQR